MPDYRLTCSVLQYDDYTSSDGWIREDVGLERCQTTQVSLLILLPLHCPHSGMWLGVTVCDSVFSKPSTVVDIEPLLVTYLQHMCGCVRTSRQTGWMAGRVCYLKSLDSETRV